MGQRWQETETPTPTPSTEAGAETPSDAASDAAPRGDGGVHSDGSPRLRDETSSAGEQPPPAGAPGGGHPSGAPTNAPGGTVTAGAPEGSLLLGTYKDLWADYVAEENPALNFLIPEQTLELNPADAERLGVRHGERVEVAADGRSLIATVGLRERMLEGTAFLARGTASDPAGVLAGARAVTVAAAPEPEPPAEADGDEGEAPAAPALVVTKREPVSW